LEPHAGRVELIRSISSSKWDLDHRQSPRGQLPQQSRCQPFSDKEIVRQQHFPGLHGPLSKLFGRLVATELPIVIEH
jgi:hypothetical protein